MNVDLEALKAFERGLDADRPEESRIPARVLGYGEISTIFEIDSDSCRDLACKRMPIFNTQAEITRYEELYNRYNAALAGIRIEVPRYGFAWFVSDGGRTIAYDIQEKLPPESIGNRAIHILDTENVRALFKLVLHQLTRVWSFNKAYPDRALGIDGQISNWAITGFDPATGQLPKECRLLYFDTSTPLVKEGGVEQLDPELFLRSAPSFMLWLIRWLFLKDVMTRYYEARLVTIDLIANFYKEQRPEMVPLLVQDANEFFAGEGKELGIRPLSEKEIKSYYSEDAIIWRVFLALRKFDRWLHRNVYHKPYVYILPGKIKR